jgi:hypothetical protein
LVHWRARAGAALCAALLSAACDRSAPEPVAATARPAVITGAYPRFGHAADFSWIAGRLAQRLNCCTYLVFNAASPTRPSGRIAVIAPPDVLARFAGGDMVVARGRLTSTPQGECGSPAFDAEAIGLH